MSVVTLSHQIPISSNPADCLKLTCIDLCTQFPTVEYTKASTSQGLCWVLKSDFPFQLQFKIYDQSIRYRQISFFALYILFQSSPNGSHISKYLSQQDWDLRNFRLLGKEKTSLLLINEQVKAHLSLEPIAPPLFDKT